MWTKGQARWAITYSFRGICCGLLAVAALSLAPGLTPAIEIPQTREDITYSFAPLVEKTAPAVVNVYAQKIVRSQSPTHLLDGSAFWQLFRDTLLFGYGRERIENSLGSGVIVGPEGVIVTNHHIVGGAEGISVALADGRVFAAEIILSDRRSDIAVLRIATGEEKLPFLEFADSDLLKVGDLVIAIGNPFGLGQTVTSGIVSALARTSVGIGDIRFFIQTDAAINPGNSGGAQIDMAGKLVGINTAIYSTSGGSQGLGFAVPSNMVKLIVESAVRGQPLVRPWIGVSGRSLPPQIAAQIGLPQLRGVIVTDLYKGGPAETAGLAIGDIVLAVDAFPVSELQALRYRIATQMTGRMARLTLMRNRSVIQIAVPLVAPPNLPPRDETRLSGLNPLSGAKVASLSPALAEEIGADSGIAGVIVFDVSSGSAADRASLQPGDIIRAFGQREIATVDELRRVRPTALDRWTVRVTRGGQDIVIGR